MPVGGQGIEQLHCRRSCDGLDIGGQNRQFCAQFQQRALYDVPRGDVFPSPPYRLELAHEGGDSPRDGGVRLLNLFSSSMALLLASYWRAIRSFSSVLSSTGRNRSNA